MENIEGKYFIDGIIYNCPFCKNRGVKYIVLGIAKFNEKINKEMFAVFVECANCHNISMHLIKENEYLSAKFRIEPFQERYANFYLIKDGCKEFETYSKTPNNCKHDYIINTYKNFSTDKFLPVCDDENIILHIPTSFFTTDERIPRKYRELIEEAEKCIQNNCMTGASACIRKAIYEFLLEQKTEGRRYEDRIKSLKGKFKTLDDYYIDMISGIQGIMCDQVHEDTIYQKFKSSDAKAYLAILKEIFNNVYVVPKEAENKKSKIAELCSQIKQEKDKKRE